MCGSVIAAEVSVFGLLLVGSVQAGVYNTQEPIPAPGTSFERFRETVGQLRSIAVEEAQKPPSRARSHYLLQVAPLQEKERDGNLTVMDRVNLSEYYLRLQKYEDAVRLLESAAREAPNFLVLANLATAYLLVDRLDRAIVYQRQALASWPALWPGFYVAELQRLRRVERALLTLMQNRLQESIRQPGKATETVDPLFPRVRFVGPSGRYEPGELAPEQRDELPLEAIDTVAQLVLWLPHDNRLYWLF